MTHAQARADFWKTHSAVVTPRPEPADKKRAEQELARRRNRKAMDADPETLRRRDAFWGGGVRS